MKFSARIGVSQRVRIDALAEEWGLTVSQAVRRIAIRGMDRDDGEPFGDADACLANEECAARMQRLEELLDGPTTPGGPRARVPSGRPPSIVTVAFPAPWKRHLKAAGGLKAAIALGLARLGLGD